jgi:hypothetical protein
MFGQLVHVRLILIERRGDHDRIRVDVDAKPGLQLGKAGRAVKDREALIEAQQPTRLGHARQ